MGDKEKVLDEVFHEFGHLVIVSHPMLHVDNDDCAKHPICGYGKSFK